ncbi:MAG: M20/M25/M40 family metallo-hydrolase [Gammaproteobacteria bacterium]|nr:M20/M25/M40 family metallo-hydrolase [Gammaproteobacteria bacterium]MDH5275880.1 M20/M25/M40 family metallo-hydrolase [Gammaproteobacteria bacterium]
MTLWRARAALLLVAVPALAAGTATGNRATPTELLARDILAELVATDTYRADDTGRTRDAAERLAAILVRARFPADDVQVLGLTPGDGNLVARYRSANPTQPPVLMLAHLDTVSTSPEFWTTSPLELVEKDGYYYGRGTRDIKSGAALLVANFIRLRAEGFQPNRDLILLFTADEETTAANLVWLLEKHRPLIDAAFALNTDAGQVELTADGKPVAFTIQTAEKVYASYALEATSAGGHSSRPAADNAIYKLARGLSRVEQLRFPRDLNESVRVYFERWAPLAPPELQSAARALGAGRLDDPTTGRLENSPYLNALIRTTCVATQLRGGTSENALPAHARAVVNCRILPQSSPAAVEATLRHLVAADGVSVSPVAPALTAAPSPLDPQVLDPVEAIANELWPGIPVLPEMSPGASDGLYLRAAGIPTYGVGAVPEDPDEDTSHAPDERIRVEAFNQSLEYWYRLTRRLAE